jgi:virginiamycin B lyase
MRLRQSALRLALIAALLASGCSADQQDATQPSPVQAYEVPDGSRPHDVAPAADGGVWFTGQRAGFLGHFDSSTQVVDQVPLGDGSAPHGVIVGGDGAAWVTDGGLNAILRVDPATREVRSYPLPEGREGANLNTATFDRDGVLWFTGQAGVYGRLDPQTEDMAVYDAPRGAGPYGITATPDGDVYYASLAGNYVGRIDTDTGEVTVLEPPTPQQGARRVWSDSTGRIWVSEWNAGQLAVFDPASEKWREWRLPGPNPQAYAVYVDDHDQVWVSDFGANALVRFDPTTETFTSYQLPGPASNVRQILGRPGEVWGAASALDQLVVLRSG